MSTLGHPEKQTDNKTTYNIHDKCRQRETPNDKQMAQLAGEIAQARADKSTYARQ